jgi:hypothetical protein
MYRGGESDSSIWSSTFQAAARPMIAAGLLSKKEYDNVMRLFKDPTFDLIGPIMFGAWGRRPAKQILTHVLRSLLLKFIYLLTSKLNERILKNNYFFGLLIYFFKVLLKTTTS